MIEHLSISSVVFMSAKSAPPFEFGLVGGPINFGHGVADHAGALCTGDRSINRGAPFGKDGAPPTPGGTRAPGNHLICALDANADTPARRCTPYRDSRERTTANRKPE